MLPNESWIFLKVPFKIKLISKVAGKKIMWNSLTYYILLGTMQKKGIIVINMLPKYCPSKLQIAFWKLPLSDIILNPRFHFRLASIIKCVYTEIKRVKKYNFKKNLFTCWSFLTFSFSSLRFSLMVSMFFSFSPITFLAIYHVFRKFIKQSQFN